MGHPSLLKPIRVFLLSRYTVGSVCTKNPKWLLFSIQSSINALSSQPLLFFFSFESLFDGFRCLSNLLSSLSSCLGGFSFWFGFKTPHVCLCFFSFFLCLFWSFYIT
ncbi:hypothetical protein F4810DRAFT_143065 [Camillea tinctor]|nr:hypothetical protein F4810DRAFT_143065 [Camillea tinctor]